MGSTVKRELHEVQKWEEGNYEFTLRRTSELSIALISDSSIAVKKQRIKGEWSSYDLKAHSRLLSAHPWENELRKRSRCVLKHIDAALCETIEGAQGKELKTPFVEEVEEPLAITYDDAAIVDEEDADYTKSVTWDLPPETQQTSFRFQNLSYPSRSHNTRLRSPTSMCCF